MKAKRLLGVLLLALVCVVGIFSLASCSSERAEVEALIIEYFEYSNIDYSNGYPYTYKVFYNIKGKDGNKYYKTLPEKYYKVTTLGCTDKVMYKGMYGNEKN